MPEKYLYERSLNKKSDYNVWFAFPECYSFALSSLGYLWLYKELDESQNVFVERIATDTQKTVLKPDEVNAIGFSFTFDMDFVNIFSMLEKYNIPLKSKDRTGKHPIIFAGGPVITANPELYKEIFDFMVIGDGEELGVDAINICSEYKDEDYNILFKKLSELDGVYVPKIHNLHNPVKKSYKKLNEPIYTPILSEDSFFSNTFIIETSRGCYNCCGFCIASYLNLPVRFVSYEKIIEKIEFGLKYTNKIALLGALVSAHPRFEDICRYIYDKVQAGSEIEMSISSMRANTLTPTVIKTLVATGQRNITIAIEAATERLRKVVNKNISEEQIFNAVRVSKENGLKGMKIYAMLGLPSETEYDVQEFVRLAKDLKTEFKGFNLTFSFSTFVPKPHTPLQWSNREDTKILEKKISYLQKEFHKVGVEARFSSPKWDYYQTLLSRGDSSLTDYIIEVYKQGGKIGAYKSSAKKLGISTDEYTTNYKYMLDSELPWDVVSIKPSKEILKKEYKRLKSLANN